MSSKKLTAMLLVFLLTLSIQALVPTPANAVNRACSQFNTCHSPFDCLWWGTRCALQDSYEFTHIVGGWTDWTW